MSPSRRPPAKKGRELPRPVVASNPQQAQQWADELAAGKDAAELGREIEAQGSAAAGGVRGLGSAVGESATALLGQLARSDDRTLAEAAIEALGDISVATAADVLGELVEELADKNLRTVARRAAHRLATRGIRPKPRADSGRPVGGPTATLYRAVGSAYDGTGTRSLWLSAERPLGAAYRIVLQLNDVAGLTECEGRDTSRKRMAEQETAMRAQDPAAWVELPVEYARQLVQESVELTRVGGGPLPVHYALWAPMIGEAESPFKEALVYQEINAFEAQMHPTWQTEAPQLFEQPEIESWFFLPDQVKKWAARLQDNPSARLVITLETEDARHARLLREAIAELLPPPALHGLRRRLEETAYIFLRTDRDLDARRAVTAAVTLEQERPLRPPHPFLRHLIERSIDIALRVERAGAQPPRLVRAP
jgi:hypothetical protein